MESISSCLETLFDHNHQAHSIFLASHFQCLKLTTRVELSGTSRVRREDQLSTRLTQEQSAFFERIDDARIIRHQYIDRLLHLNYGPHRHEHVHADEF